MSAGSIGVRRRGWPPAAAPPGSGATGSSTEIETPPASEYLAGWVRRGLDDLLAAQGAVDPDRTVATWDGPRHSAFWVRRMATETVGCTASTAAWRSVQLNGLIDIALAVDGIDELFEVIVPHRGTGELHRGRETIHLGTRPTRISGGRRRMVDHVGCRCCDRRTRAHER